MKFDVKKYLPHVLVIIVFAAIAVAYFSPVLQGKVIHQSDIVQYTGMAKQQNDFREKTGEEPYWTDAAFGGMPTYQLGAHYPHNFIKKIDLALRFLPRPADYLFLYFIGLYILLLVLKTDYKLAFLGALAFGFSTYMIILLGVGHNSKAHAIAYMPWVLAGIILCFRKRFLWGGVLLTLGAALEIEANHFQMTYYLLLLIVVIGVVYFIDALKKKLLPDFFKAIGVMLIAGIIALGANATLLMATQQYTAFSTRGDTGLTINTDGTPKKSSGLDYDYITEYSYGIGETFNLFVPRFMGGSSTEKLSEDSHVYDALLKLGANHQQAMQFINNAPTYWGEQTFIGAPAYIGASVIFLFFLATFLVKGKLKWWILAGSILTLFLSWGDNFAGLTKFFINYVPLYNKFRAVSSIQVIIELCVPVFGLVGLAKLFSDKKTSEEKIYALKWATIITGGLAVLFLISAPFMEFIGAQDRAMIQQLGIDFVNALRDDRRAMLITDSLRSLAFVLIAAAASWFFLKEKLSKNTVVLVFLALIVIDLVSVDKRYVNNDNFVNARVMQQPFQPNEADNEIRKDPGHFRVLDLTSSPLNSARASYFHNSLGGYHAAKPGRMQELFDFYIYKGNQQVLNMLNTKYMIVENQGTVMAQPNPDVNGNAWFVSNIKEVNSVNDEMLALDSLNTKKVAVMNKKFSEQVPQKTFTPAASDTIYLKNFSPNKLTYHYSTKQDQFGVFSEIYYPHGWNAYIDGKEIPIVAVDYVLRGASLPAGTHDIVFKFEPQVIKTGGTIMLASELILGLIILGGLVYTYRRKQNESLNG